MASITLEALGRRLLRQPAIPIAVLIWTASYFAVDLIMWWNGRSTLLSNIVISLPMIASAIMLTWLLTRLQAHLKSWPFEGRSITIILAIIVVATLQWWIDYSLVWFFAWTIFPDWQPLFERLGTSNFAFGTYVYAVEFAVCMLLHALVIAIGSIERGALREARISAAYSRAEATALRLQLNPHFLFNALNSIASLRPPGRTEHIDEMICRLADFLRASIAADPMADVPLSDEIATIEAYLAIEQLRFGSRLQVIYELDPGTLTAPVPNFILQPLVENAIKHGVAKTRSHAVIVIAARRAGDLLVVSVANTQTPGPRAELHDISERPGIGLANIRQRLNLLESERAALTTERLPNGFRATLMIPFHGDEGLSPDAEARPAVPSGGSGRTLRATG